MEARVTPGTNLSSPINTSHWFQNDFGGYPLVYPITLEYLYPVIVLGRVMHIVWYFIGMVGNMLSMKIWMIPRMRRLNKSALYLVSLTLCDISIQILHVFSYLKYFWGLPALGTPVLCEVWNILNMIPQYSSQMLVLAFTIERFISIYKPFRSERFSKRQRAPRTIIIIYVTAVAFSIIQGYLWEVDQRGFCEQRLSTKINQLSFVWSIVTEIIFFFVIPLLTLLLNMYVLKETCKSFEDREMENNGNIGECRVHRTSRSNFRPATVTLVSVSFFRICTQLPISVTYTLQDLEGFSFGPQMPISEMQHDPQWRRFISYWGARIIIEAIGVSYHALSVFIFCGSTRQFRKELYRILTKMIMCGRNKHRSENGSTYFRSGYGQSITRTTSNTVKTRICHQNDNLELHEINKS